MTTVAPVSGEPTTTRPWLRALLAIAIVAIGCVAAVLLLEGSISLFLFANDFVRAGAPRGIERPHMRHDSLLGWSNKPSTTLPNEYGQGIGFSTDAQGFRTSPAAAATAATTVVCSGDSFAMGYGVSDGDAWCALLARELPGVRTINLAQAGYGLDQSVLWYARDGVMLRPKIHLLALTDLQFERSLSTDFQGRFKPVFVLDNGHLRTSDVPVPPQTAAALRSAYRGRLLEDLRVVQWLRRFDAMSPALRAVRDVNERWPLFDAMLDSVARLDRANGVTPVIVYLPNRRDLRRNHLEARRERIAASAKAHGIEVVDLTPALRKVRADTLDRAFINDVPAGAAPGVAGHYSKVGNAWVARELAARLRELLKP